jgi:hypothetical protein
VTVQQAATAKVRCVIGPVGLDILDTLRRYRNGLTVPDIAADVGRDRIQVWDSLSRRLVLAGVVERYERAGAVLWRVTEAGVRELDERLRSGRVPGIPERVRLGA